MRAAGAAAGRKPLQVQPAVGSDKITGHKDENKNRVGCVRSPVGAAPADPSGQTEPGQIPQTGDASKILL